MKKHGTSELEESWEVISVQILHFTDEGTEGSGYVTCSVTYRDVARLGQGSGASDSSSVFSLVSHEALIYKHSSPTLERKMNCT